MAGSRGRECLTAQPSPGPGAHLVEGGREGLAAAVQLSVVLEALLAVHRGRRLGLVLQQVHRQLQHLPPGKQRTGTGTDTGTDTGMQ